MEDITSNNETSSQSPGVFVQVLQAYGPLDFFHNPSLEFWEHLISSVLHVIV